jgi:hypothetical protein
VILSGDAPTPKRCIGMFHVEGEEAGRDGARSGSPWARLRRSPHWHAEPVFGVHQMQTPWMASVSRTSICWPYRTIVRDHQVKEPALDVGFG